MVDLAKTVPGTDILSNLGRKLEAIEETIANLDQRTGGDAFDMLAQEMERLKSHYTELAAEMGCATEEGRQIVHDLAKAGPTSIRLNPDTDWISTVPPLSLIPTPYRITVDGQQKWYAQ